MTLLQGCTYGEPVMEQSKIQEALQIAKEIAKKCKSERDFHNAFFGIYGKFGEMFPTRAEREEFIKTPEYQEILALRTELSRMEKAAT